MLLSLYFSRGAFSLLRSSLPRHMLSNCSYVNYVQECDCTILDLGPSPDTYEPHDPGARITIDLESLPLGTASKCEGDNSKDGHIRSRKWDPLSTK